MERFLEEEFCKYSYPQAVTRTKDFLDRGRSLEALSALEFIVKNFQEVELEVKEVLQDLRTLLGKDQKTDLHQLPKNAGTKFPGEIKSEIYCKNLEILNSCFPEIAGYLEKVVIPAEFSQRKNTSGQIVLEYKNISLINLEKPERAAEVWAEQIINSPKFLRAQELLICGFAPSFHLKALKKRTAKRIHVFENSLEALKATLSLYDCRELIEGISSFNIDLKSFKTDLSEKISNQEIELFIFPQAKLLAAQTVDNLLKTIISIRGVQQIKPGIGVVGPMYGGSLPIAKYTTQALLQQQQRTFGYDLSPFFKGFNQAGSLFKNLGRKAVVETRYLEMLSDLVLEGINERPIDIMICLAQAPLTPKVLEEVRKRGIITVMWFVEDCYRFQTWKHLAPYFDYWFVIQKEAVRMIEAAGAPRVIYLPLACDPNIHRPLLLSPKEKEKYGSDISFLGAGYNNRTNMFATLVNRDFKIWGTEWPTGMPFSKLVQDAGRRLEPEEYIKVFNASKINLNLHSSAERDGVEPNGDFVNPRTFELAACGAFQLADERTLMPELFQIGKEMAVFHDRQEMIEQIDYYLARPQERMEIVQASRKRVLAEHTYGQRVKDMLEYIYLDKYEQLKAKQEESQWHKTLRAAEKYPQLEIALQNIYQNNEEPQFKALADKVIAKKGILSEHDQKILFLHHLYTQVATIEGIKNGPS